MATKNIAIDAQPAGPDRPPPSAPLRAGLRQAPQPCPTCGSFYRRGDDCNICGFYAPDRIMVEADEREPMPRQYSKHGKFHTMQKIIRY